MFTLLVVDDNPLICQGIEELIDWNRYGVQYLGSCRNGMEGYEKAKELEPDFIITDVEMPILNGIEMASRLCRELPGTRFIFISCFEDFHYIKEAMDLHAYKYVLKPLVMEDLAGAVCELCNEKQQIQIQQAVRQDLIQTIKKSLPALQQEFFQELIYARTVDEETIRAHMDYLGLARLRGKQYIAVLVAIDNRRMQAQEQAEQDYLVNEGVKKFIAENILNALDAYLMEQSFDSLAYAVFFSGDDVPEQIARLAGRFRDGADDIRKTFGAEVTVGVSGQSGSLKDFAAVLLQARRAVKYRFYANGNPLIFYEDISQVAEGEAFDLQQIKTELKDLLATDSHQSVEDFLNRWYDQSMHMSREYACSFAFSVFTVLWIIAMENGTTVDSVTDNGVETYERINSFATLPELHEWLADTLHTAVRQAAPKPNAFGKHSRIVQDIKHSIDVNYAKINNIEEVVRPLYISASHANTIFKKATGITIFDYLLERRIAEAKKLLADPYIKVYEVSERIGYRNISYFSMLFKEHTGMTPREYADFAATDREKQGGIL